MASLIEPGEKGEGAPSKSSNRRLLVARKKTVLDVLRVIYRDIHGIQISRDRRDHLIDEKHLTYGEVRIDSFDQALNLASRYVKCGNAAFYDIGSGTGKAVFCAAYNTHITFTKACGIELVPELCQASQGALDLLTESLKIAKKTSKESTSMGRDPPGRVKKPLTITQRELDIHMDTVLASVPSDTRESELANALCKILGHKSFKASIKPFKTFHGYYTAYQAARAAPEGGLEEEEEMEEEEMEEVEEGPAVRVVRALHKQDALEALQVPAPAPIAFLCGDIFELTRWTEDASVVYASSLLFNSAMMAALVGLVVKMRPGSVFMTLKELPLEDFAEEVRERHVELVFSSWYEMSWHRARIYFYSVGEGGTKT
jgi:hypothetical protein